MLRFDLSSPFPLFDELMSAPAPRPKKPSIPLEVHATDDGVVVHAPLPGLEPSSLDVSLERGTLRIRGERRPLFPDAGAKADEAGGETAAETANREPKHRVLCSELPTGPVDVRFRLGFRPDAAGVRATYELGVLRVDVPRATEERPLQIPVHTPELTK